MRTRTIVPALGLAGIALLGAGDVAMAGPPAAGPDARQSTITQTVQRETITSKHRLGRPRIYMAWGAPWGRPHARDSAIWACDDTLAADTLYLTFDPGEDIRALMGIDATLIFHAAPGDTLGPFWDLSRKGVNPFNLRIEFNPPPEGTPSPWPVTGVGNPRYEVKGDTGRLDLGYFVAASRAGPVFADTVYFFARVMVRMRKPYLAGCRQPVCVDFDHLLVGHSDGDRWINIGERFTSWNSPGGSVCSEYRKRPPSEEPMRFGGRYDLKAAPGDTTPTVRDTTHR